MTKKDYSKCLETRPKHVAIVGLGRSFPAFCLGMTAIHVSNTWPEEVWGINYAMNFLRCDKVFFMDGLDFVLDATKFETQEENLNAIAWYESMKDYDTPIIVGGRTTGFKAAVPYPINDVCRSTLATYFSNTVAYAVAYACYLRKEFGCVEKIDMFGCDFTYESEHEGYVREAEANRAGVEFWCGYACSLGINVSVPEKSTLLNAHEGLFRMYGYDEPPVERATSEAQEEQS